MAQTYECSQYDFNMCADRHSYDSLPCEHCTKIPMKPSDTFEYKGHTFTRTNGMWKAVKDGVTAGTSMYRNDIKDLIDHRERQNKKIDGFREN